MDGCGWVGDRWIFHLFYQYHLFLLYYTSTSSGRTCNCHVKMLFKISNKNLHILNIPFSYLDAK